MINISIFPMVVQEAVWTHYCSKNISNVQEKNKIQKYLMSITIVFCLPYSCCASVQCLYIFFKRLFESSHAFERRFERWVSTSLSSQVTLCYVNAVIICLFEECSSLLPEQGKLSATVVWCQRNSCLLCLAYIYIVFLPLSSAYVCK